MGSWDSINEDAPSAAPLEAQEGHPPTYKSTDGVAVTDVKVAESPAIGASAAALAETMDTSLHISSPVLQSSSQALASPTEAKPASPSAAVGTASPVVVAPIKVEAPNRAPALPIATPAIPPLSKEPLPFLHGPAQVQAVHMIDVRVRAWVPILETAAEYMREQLKMETMKATQYRKFNTAIGRWVLDRQDNTMPDIVATKEVQSKIQGALNDLANEHEMNIKIVQTQFIDELHKFEKECNKKRKYFHDSFEPLLQAIKKYRNKLSDDVNEHAHLLSLFKHDATVDPAEIPKDPWLTSGQYQAKVAFTVGREQHIGQKLVQVMTEVARWDEDMTKGVGRITQNYEAWKTKSYALEQSKYKMLCSLFDPTLHPNVGTLSPFYHAFLEAHKIPAALAPTFTVATYLPSSHSLPSPPPPLYEGFLLRPPKKGVMDKKHPWRPCYAVLTAFGYLHLFTNVISINEDPEHIKARALGGNVPNSAEGGESKPSSPVSPTAPSTLTRAPSARGQQQDTSPEKASKKDHVKTFFLRQALVSVGHNVVTTEELNAAPDAFAFSVSLPRMERGFLGMGKKKERGKSDLIILRALDKDGPAHKETWVSKLEGVLIQNTRETPN